MRSIRSPPRTCMDVDACGWPGAPCVRDRARVRVGATGQPEVHSGRMGGQAHRARGLYILAAVRSGCPRAAPARWMDSLPSPNTNPNPNRPDGWIVCHKRPCAHRGSNVRTARGAAGLRHPEPNMISTVAIARSRACGTLTLTLTLTLTTFQHRLSHEGAILRLRHARRRRRRCWWWRRWQWRWRLGLRRRC